MKKLTSRPFNVAIVPPREISDRAITLSKRLKRKSGLFVLGDERYIPHITLYMVQLPLSNLEKVRTRLRKILRQGKPFSITSTHYRQNADGFVDMAFRKPQNLRDLQMKIVQGLNPLRQRLLRENDKKRMADFTKREQKNVAKYGFRSIDEDYFPHLTLTGLKKRIKIVTTHIQKSDLSFPVTKVGLFYLGKHGTCQKKVEIFDLQ